MTRHRINCIIWGERGVKKKLQSATFQRLTINNTCVYLSKHRGTFGDNEENANEKILNISWWIHRHICTHTHTLNWVSFIIFFRFPMNALFCAFFFFFVGHIAVCFVLFFSFCISSSNTNSYVEWYEWLWNCDRKMNILQQCFVFSIKDDEEEEKTLIQSHKAAECIGIDRQKPQKPH